MEPDFIESVLAKASDLLETGKPAESLQCLEQLEGMVSEPEDRIECGTLRAWALSEMDRVDDAIQTLEPLIDEFPNSARLHGTFGVVLSNADELEAARASLEKAVSLDNRDDVAASNLALVCEKMGDLGTAIKLYDRALDLGAELDWTLQRTAAVLYDLGDVELARKTLKRYLSLAPDDAEQWITLGIWLSDSNLFEEAAQAFARSEEINAESPTLRLHWGESEARAGHVKSARRQLKLLQKLSPGSPLPSLLRAWILEQEQNFAAADKCYREAIERVRPEDYSELTFTLEASMDFYVDLRDIAMCERIFEDAYFHNACTIELCEAYRESSGEKIKDAVWFSTLVEADFRDDLTPWIRRGREGDSHPARYYRNIQIVAKDRDEAIASAVALLERMGERNVRFVEFLGSEPLEEAFTGVYEVGYDIDLAGDDAAVG
ncbi:MAG: tetratricopeptide repeat protein [Phycisphaerales bacterium]|nr:tetratricopeptide repeat protein [Phycisphaerales bacterium]